MPDLSGFQPDVMILDIQLSGGSGIEVLREVKRMPHAPVVIMLTNLVSSECRTACWEAGAEFFIDKSFGYEQLTWILEGPAVEAAILPTQVPTAPARMERPR